VDTSWCVRVRVHRRMRLRDQTAPSRRGERVNARHPRHSAPSPIDFRKDSEAPAASLEGQFGPQLWVLRCPERADNLGSLFRSCPILAKMCGY
jgi:hypothetical protein